MMPLRRGLTVVALALAASGCSTVSGWFGGSGPAIKPTPLAEFTASANVETSWRVNLGAGRGLALAPAVDGDAIYAAAANGNLVRLELATGREIWRVDAGKRISGGVGAGGGVVAVGTPEGEVLVFDAGGAPKWTTRIGTEVLSPPQVAEGIVVVRGSDGRLFGFDAQTGTRKWAYQRANPALTLRNFAGAHVARGAVFSGFPGGKLAALRLDNGLVGWEATVAQPRGATELERIADITSTPGVVESAVCAAAFQGRVGCFEVRSGTSLWSSEFSSHIGLDVDARGVYVTNERGELVGFDRVRGTQLWKQQQLAGRGTGRPAAVGSLVAVGDFQGYVHFLRPGDGAFVARVATDGSPIVAAPVVTAQGILVQTADGGLFLLRAG
ncbi:MAG: outer membrane protein assembly factor BamB [Pseudomonadota bacterium]